MKICSAVLNIKSNAFLRQNVTSDRCESVARRFFILCTLEHENNEFKLLCMTNLNPCQTRCLRKICIFLYWPKASMVGSCSGSALFRAEALNSFRIVESHSKCWQDRIEMQIINSPLRAMFFFLSKCFSTFIFGHKQPANIKMLHDSWAMNMQWDWNSMAIWISLFFFYKKNH